ncbi:MAG: ATP-binding protein, partial [Candidatus Zixiibacteriota bacterium]
TSLLKNRGGEIVGAVELFQDVSKLKRMEEQISQMKVLASLGEMAASIAHEVRNPLSGIGGFAALLSRDLENDPDKKRMADKIVEGVTSINNTIQTLLDFARREKLEKSNVDLNRYLNDMLDEFVGMNCFKDAAKRIDRCLSPEDSIAVDLDSQLFRQVIFNFVKNGLEAGREDGRVKVTARPLPLSLAQREYGEKLQLSGSETLAQIIIEDNGSGIKESDLKRLFSPFYSNKENGIGLGLSIAWKIIKAHGGDVAAKTQLGKGTTFSILLPARKG